jgi:hypothetical protein
MSTYTPIASQTLGSAAASVTFSSIPQGYTDLVLVSRMGNSNAATGFGSGLTLNNDAVATGKLSFTILYGNGSAAGSFRWTTSTSGNVTVPLGIEGTTLNAGGMSVMQLMNYSNSTTFKTILTRGGAAGSDTLTYVSLWQDTSPINKITIYPNDATNTILSGSTFSIYGIQVGASTQKAQGGNIVVSDGTYMYHAFTSSGSFTPSQSLTADVLVIAGGGGAGGTYGQGGGGAGGLVYSASQSLTASKSYVVSVGAGGNGAIEYAIRGSNSNVTGYSLSLTAAVGGGASAGTTALTNGGSGAGGTYTDGTNGWYTGSGTAGQGNNGGLGLTTGGGDKSSGGGGGGAGAAGANAGATQAGAGGVGSSAYSSWGAATKTGQLSSSTYYYAGGGGGGTDNRVSGNAGGAGGLGGGGAGGTNGTAGTAALANTGGGGGGGGYNSGGPGTSGGNGGSGIVIIRYLL